MSYKDELSPPHDDRNAAANLIRSKLDRLYASEPNAKDEIAEVSSMPEKALSEHQYYMKQLNDSGMSLAEIQTAWHKYYERLSDTKKHEVWQEFYDEHQRIRETPKDTNKTTQKPANEPAPNPHQVRIPSNPPKHKDTRTRAVIKNEIVTRAQATNLHKNHKVRSLAFGLSMGVLTMLVLLFSFFNERFITPFIRPSHNVSATPIIVDPNANGPVGPEPKIIIPKINLEAPVVYDVPTIEEKAVEAGLERGVVHYATTPNPGEKGNSVIFGHSSSNILNKGKYKFAFILLKSLDKDDTFIVQKDGKRYVYKIYNKYVTSPEDISVLGPTDRPAIMTLITCDPPGTSTHRLIIQAEQIFPDPAANTDSTAIKSTSQPSKLPSNSPSLWSRIKGWF